MNTLIAHYCNCNARRKAFRHLAFLLILSVVFGLYLVRISDQNFVSLMSVAPGCCASIVDLLTVAVYPFFLAAVFVMIFRSYGLVLLCSLKLSCFTVLLSGAVLHWGLSSWLVSFLLLFSCGISCTCLLWFTMRCYLHENIKVHLDLLICILISIAAAVIEHLVFAPFLAKIIL